MASTPITTVLGQLAELTKTWKQALITLVFLGVLGAGVLTFQFLSGWIAEYNHYNEVVARLEMDDSIQTTTDRYIRKIGADRITIGELHDGKTNVSGVRFGYLSATYESTAPGVAQIVMNMQNLPTSMFAGYWAQSLEGKCTVLNIADGDVVPSVHAFMVNNGVDNLILCPIHSPAETEKLIGMSMAMWMDDDPVDNITQVTKDIQEMSLVISGALDGRS